MQFDQVPHQWLRVARWPAGMFISLAASAALACSTVVLGLPERPVIAYSFDFAASDAGFLFINPNEGTRRSIMEGDPAEWTIRYGSITFNQIGPGMPAAGMNTAGLVVTLMWNPQAVYKSGGNAPVVNELEFIQRLLDTSASVDDALAALRNVRIDGMIPIHFLIADRFANTAIVTPTSSELLIHTGEEMPIPALTNTSYADLIQEITHFEGFGGERASPSDDGPDDPSSLQRFVMAAMASTNSGSSTTKETAFKVLGDVFNSETRWQIMFDPQMQKIVFRIVDQETIHQINLQDFDFRCLERPLFAEMNTIHQKDFLDSLAPVNQAKLRDVSHEILASFPQAAGLGPNIADGLTIGLLEALSCTR